VTDEHRAHLGQLVLGRRHERQAQPADVAASRFSAAFVQVGLEVKNKVA